MEIEKNNNFKKLLCYNIVNNLNCVYKHKCMFAHNIEEQIKEPNREFIHNMLFIMDDLSNINIKENKEIFDELVILTKECKNCKNKKCPGGYNCKFGSYSEDLIICYNDLINGKCECSLSEQIINNKIIKKCKFGIHLTEKNLIPYHQRIICEINPSDYNFFIFNNVKYHNKINIFSIILNDNSIKFVKNFITKNKINKNEIIKNIFNKEKNNQIDYLFNNIIDNDILDDNILDDDILEEYKIEKTNNAKIILDEYFWRYDKTKNFNNNDIENNFVNNNNEENIQAEKPILNNISEKIMDVIKTIDEYNNTVI